jgi:Bardet-Biedl syndrome 1 protein
MLESSWYKEREIGSCNSSRIKDDRESSTKLLVEDIIWLGVNGWHELNDIGFKTSFLIYAYRNNIVVVRSLNGHIPSPLDGPDLTITMSTSNPAMWLNAWHDPVASIQTASSCIRIADVTGDGDPKLLVADQNRTLRMYKGQINCRGLENWTDCFLAGMNLISVHGLLDVPSAICTFYDDSKSAAGPRLPSLAVACGPFIFIYKRLRPHYKFTLPGPKIDDEELAIWQVLYSDWPNPFLPQYPTEMTWSGWEWQGVNDGKVDPSAAYEQLGALRDRGTLITNQAIDFLGTDDPQARVQFLIDARDKLPTLTTTITAMESLNKKSEDEDATSCLVVGTEHRHLCILDSNSFAIIVKAVLPSVPVFICTSGMLDVEYRYRTPNPKSLTVSPLFCCLLFFSFP